MPCIKKIQRTKTFSREWGINYLLYCTFLKIMIGNNHYWFVNGGSFFPSPTQNVWSPFFWLRGRNVRRKPEEILERFKCFCLIIWVTPQGGGSVAWLPANIIFSWKKRAVGPRNTLTKMTTMTPEPALNTG